MVPAFLRSERHSRSKSKSDRRSRRGKGETIVAEFPEAERALASALNFPAK